MSDNPLQTEMEFAHERKFSKWLSDRLNGATVKRGVRFPDSRIGRRFTLQTAHESGGARDDGQKPDIEVSHDIEFDLPDPRREDSVIAPTNPFYIECKMGNAYREPESPVENRTDTGIPALQRRLGDQIQSYQRGLGEGSPRRWTVFVTCPYMLDGIFDKKKTPGFSADQFRQTLRGLNLGLVYRHKRGIVLEMDSNNSYLVLSSDN